MPQITKHQDPYPFHRSALAPLLPDATHADMEHSCTAAIELGETAFAEFLCQQGLAPLWDEHIEHYPGPLPLSSAFTELIHQARLHATGAYLIQRHSLALIRDILDEAGVSHVVTKGAHTREVYYDTPALRPATDIDVLVRQEDKLQAIKAFQAKGFKFYGAVENIAQDCSLVKGNTNIDLHWDILRPGRTRKPMVEALLDCRTDYGSHWGMTHGATLFLMLVHPVFRKYSTTPQASLVRLMDIIYLLERHPGSAEEAGALLQAAGLTTAGWITATWLHTLTGDSNAKALADVLKPGKLKQKYLQNWLNTNRATRLLDKPQWIHLGFTLPAHDTWADAIRATLQARRCRHEANSTLISLKKRVS